MTKKLGATLAALLTALALVGTIAGPASAAAAVGIVSGSGSNDAGTIRADCLYTATLPSTNPNYNSVSITASAEVTANSPLNPVVSTRVLCRLSGYLSGGSAGITLPGPAATIAGTGEFERHQDPNLCVDASGSFLLGDEVELEPSPVCKPL